ncbi:Surfactin synthase thioesterase subunit [Ruminococcus sp. YE71]|uniref:thioesterase II family protein n=1 Tax=unclassified Ruminococcus TaxID=2608920 RepID=UPI00088FD7B4|nr:MULTISPECIES: thioesterase domain-containing protein [unclassified Ruminococcus]SDA26106.1 Surfactin synthase thioesterase subunit [Ruminococcus sp. YE78]SFW35886.1 Surfactin synthase thioesterase subunit [Ruminococcus sp. YE71]
MNSTYGVWFPTVRSSETAEFRIICFPHAGAGASAYLDWCRFIPNNAEFFPCAYPMREKRHRESMPGSLRILAEDIAKENKAVFTEKPCILFGHCEGAVIAYETALAVREIYGVSPALLVMSASNPPCVPLSISVDENMDIYEAAETFRKFGFIADAFAKNETYIRCFVPVLLKDFVLFQKYSDDLMKKVDCPILEVHGSDDKMILPEHANMWKKYTDCGADHIEYSGAHFYFSAETLPRLINEMLDMVTKKEERKTL